ncbi:helix-turn-helix domain-containing protein [Terrabacter ginsenosidimutans]
MLSKGSESAREGASRLTPRFYTLDDVAVLLATTLAQVYSLVRSGDLPAIKIGGRGRWRVEVTMLDQWIADQYEVTRAYIAENPMSDAPGKVAAPEV